MEVAGDSGWWRLPEVSAKMKLGGEGMIDQIWRRSRVDEEGGG